MVDSKTPDNVIPFPKKYRRPTTPEQDKVCLLYTSDAADEP